MVILILPIQAGMAETTIDEPDNSESVEIQAEDVEEVINEEDNYVEVEEENDAAPPEINDDIKRDEIDLLEESEVINEFDDGEINSEEANELDLDQSINALQLSGEECSLIQTSSVFYDGSCLSVSKTAQTADTVSLRLVFEGISIRNSGPLYINYRFPRQVDGDFNVININNNNIESTSASLEITSSVDGLKSEPIYITPSLHSRNAIYLEYNMSGNINNLRDKHKFILNITLKNEAFPNIESQDSNSYLIRALGTTSPNPFTEGNNSVLIRTDTVTIDFSRIGDLSLDNVPETLFFQTTEIGKVNYIPLNNDPRHIISVNDTRSNMEWKLSAQTLEPFSSESDNIAPLSIGILDDNIYQSLNDALVIARSNEHREGPSTINLNQLTNGDLVVSVEDLNLLSGIPYSTTIEWTLSDAP